jgi:hypothetical protein
MGPRREAAGLLEEQLCPDSNDFLTCDLCRFAGLAFLGFGLTGERALTFAVKVQQIAKILFEAPEANRSRSLY